MAKLSPWTATFPDLFWAPSLVNLKNLTSWKNHQVSKTWSAMRDRQRPPFYIVVIRITNLPTPIQRPLPQARSRDNRSNSCYGALAYPWTALERRHTAAWISTNWGLWEIIFVGKALSRVLQVGFAKTRDPPRVSGSGSSGRALDYFPQVTSSNPSLCGTCFL